MKKALPWCLRVCGTSGTDLHRLTAFAGPFGLEMTRICVRSLDVKTISAIGRINGLTNTIDEPMGLFKADLYRSFAIGFALGAVLVFGSLGINVGGGIVNSVAPVAVAAPAE